MVIWVGERAHSPTTIHCLDDWSGANPTFIVTIYVGRVPIQSSKLVCAVEDFEAVLVGFGGAIESGQAHQAEAKGCDLRTISAKMACWKF